MQEIIDNLIELIIKSRKRKTVRGFLTDLKQALGIGGKSSDYKYFTVNGVKCSIRVSNHNAKASNYANRNSRVFNNTSIVIKSSRKSPNTFAPDNKLVIKEYVYFRPDLEGNSDMFPLIVEGIAELLQTGKYIDKTGIAKQNISPEEGNNLSGNKSKAFSCFDCSLLTKRNSKYYCQRWSCYFLKKSIKFCKEYDLNTDCIPHSRLFENIITLAKLRTTAPLSGTPENPIQKFQENIWKNGLNSVTLKQLDNIINDIQNGKYLQTDFGRLIGYGRPRYDSIALSADVLTRGRIGTSCADREADCGNGQARISHQTELLTEFAKLSGCWIADYQEQREDFVYVNGQ